MTTTSKPRTLFRPVTPTARHLKVLLHGTYGTGKTCAALSFPPPIALLDLEGGSTLYDSGFDVLRTKEIRQVEAALTELAQGRYSTVVIDPLTVFWQLLQDAGQALVDRRSGDSLESGQALSPREWGIIKRRHASVLTRLVNLPLHVVLIARDTDLYEGSGSQLKKVGVKADVEKSVPYVADFVLACGTAPTSDGPDRFFAVVEKSRSPRLPKGRVLDGYRADPAQGLYPVHLAALAAGQSTGERVELDDEALVAAANGSALADEPGAAPAEAAGRIKNHRGGLCGQIHRDVARAAHVLEFGFDRSPAAPSMHPQVMEDHHLLPRPEGRRDGRLGGWFLKPIKDAHRRFLPSLLGFGAGRDEPAHFGRRAARQPV